MTSVRCAVWLVFLLLAAVGAQSDALRQYMRIPEQPLEYALQEFARQSNVDVLAPAELVKGRFSRQVEGYLTAKEAMAALLEGSGLEAVQHDDRSLSLELAGTVEGSDQRGGVATGIGAGRRVGPQEADVARSAGKIEEVIVTATRRTEDLQAISLSLTAITAPQLQSMGAVNFQDYARTVPGMSFVDAGPSHNKIVIRGISTDVAYESSATTALYFDEVPVTASAANPDLKMVDIERVEVLRGPQGTLYGEAAMGGTIRIVTARPDLRTLDVVAAGTLSGTESGALNWGTNGVVNIPLVPDRLAVRVVGYYYGNDGFIDNVPLGIGDINQERTMGGRFAARGLVTDELRLDLTIIHQNAKFSARNTFMPKAGDLHQLQVREEPLEDIFTIYNLTAALDLGRAVISSSTSYHERKLEESQDYSAVLTEIAPILGRADLVDVPADLQNFGDISAVVHETRVVSADDVPLRWLLGLYLSDRTDALPQRIVAQPAGSPPEVLFDTLIGERQADQVATFGELTYEITDALALTAGWRWFRIRQHARVAAMGVYAGGFIDVAGNASSDGVIPRYAVSYKLGEDKLIYLQAAKGFRQGGATVGLATVPGNELPTQFEPDLLWSYELGNKTAWLDGRLVVNAAIFDIEWSGIQTTIDHFGNFLTGNAGNARSRGAELEVYAKPSERVELTFAGSWIDAHLTTDQVPPNDGLAGQRMPGVPRESFSASARYVFPLTPQWRVYGQLDYRYVGDSLNGFRTAFGSNVPADEQPAYDLTNLRLGLSNARCDVELYADNLFDERAALFIDRTIDLRHHTNRPRTIGIAFRTHFGDEN